MKKVVKLGVLVICLLLLTGCQKDYMKEISYKEYKELLENKETFILEIMRTDCSACINFKPKITEVANSYKVEVKFINTDHITDDEADTLFSETGVTGTPTVIFYKDGVEETVSSRINGSVSKDRIISKFKTNGFIKE